MVVFWCVLVSVIWDFVVCLRDLVLNSIVLCGGIVVGVGCWVGEWINCFIVYVGC